MPYSTDDNGFVVNDLEQRHIARVAEGNNQFPHKWACTHFAASEGKAFEQAKPVFDGAQRLFGQLALTGVARELSLDDEVEQAHEVFLGLARQLDPVGHRLAAVLPRLRARALSKRACNLVTTDVALT